MKTLIHWAGDARAEKLALTAFAFDADGALTDAVAVRDDQVVLEVAQRGARVFIAPDAHVAQRKPTIDELQKLRAYEPALRIVPGRERIEIAPIPPDLLVLWPLPFCRIRGRVVRPLQFFGFHLTLPVCRARVHICEVDPLILVLTTLPDPLIHRLRDDLLAELTKIRYPIPKPAPAPGPLTWLPMSGIDAAAGPVDPVPWRSAARGRMATAASMLAVGDAVALNPQPLPPKERVLAFAQPMAVDLPSADLVRLSSLSTLTVREALLDNVVLLYPILCALPWFWPLLICDEVRVVETDDQGRFDTWMRYPPKGDVPDLYFWVEYFIGGAWQTVYRPSIHCHTYWNYVCGTEVTIPITDPRVPGCFPRPPTASSLLVYGIGNIPVEGIDIAGYAEGGNGGDYAIVTQRPFANVLDLMADFPIKSLLTAKSITHFLWSYRRQGGGEAEWTPLTEPFSRRYRVDFADDTHLSKLYPIQIDASGRFPIPSEEPWIDLETGSVVGGDWEVGQFLTAQVDTTGFPKRTTVDAEGLSFANNDASGEFEFKLELFKSDGTRVDFTNDGIGIQVQDIDHPLTGGTIPWKPVDPENRYLAGGTHLAGFRMPTVVDNNACEAQIFEARVGASLAGRCGFIHYAPGDSVELAYRVRHIRQRATFAFDINRGSVGVIEYCRNQAGDPIAVAYKAALEPAATSSYLRSAYRFARLATVLEMLSDCPQGAFNEALYVAATATDGYRRAYWLDAAATPMAFALAPEPAV